MKTREEIMMIFVDAITENEKEKLTTLNDFQFALYMYGANSTTVNVLRHKLTTIGEKETLIKNGARINFYVLLVYLYRQKKKDAKNAFSARYIELYTKKKNSPAIISRGIKERREGNFMRSAIRVPCLTRNYP